MTCCRIHQLINPRQKEIVFVIGLIEVEEVDADFLFVTFLLHRDQVGEPTRIGTIEVSS